MQVVKTNMESIVEMPLYTDTVEAQSMDNMEFNLADLVPTK